MLRISKHVERLEKKIETKYKKLKPNLSKYLALVIGGMYFYGMFVNSVRYGIEGSFGDGAKQSLIEWSPIKNITGLFSKYGLGVTFIIVLFYLLINNKGKSLISGYKTIKDKARGLEILPEGTHGTSGWLRKKDMGEMFDIGPIKDVKTPLLGKLTEDDTEYVGIKDVRGFNKNIIVYGAPGTGKSQGFVKPFVMSAVQRRESCILVDPKSEFFEAFSEYFKKEGYVVKALNLLDMENSDGFNCLFDTANDLSMVQSVAEVIIRNTSNADERQDFWEKSEKNLLMALMLYVGSLTYPGTNKLLPIEERSLGTIYKLMSTTSFNSLDALFRALPMGHPALNPYGIFKQAARQLWGNIAIGLGSRLNVFQDELVDKITKYNEIDLELPGKQPCAYFCIISDQDSSKEFLSSLFFSLLFVKLSDYARKHGVNRRLPVEVNVILDEFSNIGKILDFKRTISTVRSRGINCQVIVQSVAQLADRYPRTEWQEIVGNADTQVLLGCNDQLTAEMFSKLCGDMSIRINDATIPMTPLFSPVLHTTRPYSQMKKSAARALMLPDEIRRLPKNESIVLVRGELPLKLFKILPDEHPEFKKLVNVRVNEYIPLWRRQESENIKDISQEPKDKNLMIDTLVADTQIKLEDFIPKQQNAFPEQEALYLDESETELNPVKSIDLGSATEMAEVAAHDV